MEKLSESLIYVMNEHILICADPIWPDLDKFNEEDWLRRVRNYGILGTELYFDNGLGIYYNPTILRPKDILEGMQTFSLVESPEVLVWFKYEEDLSALNVMIGDDNLIAQIPLNDYLSIQFT